MAKKTEEQLMQEMEERMHQRELIESEIRALVSQLSASSSPIGDWKVIKIYEARLSNQPDPYDFAALSVARQNARTRINELQAQLEQLDD